MNGIDEFYKTKISSASCDKNTYIIRGIVTRRDTGEVVYYKTTFNSSENDGINNITSILNDETRGFLKPTDWNNPVRILLFKYLKYKDELDSLSGSELSSVEKENIECIFKRLSNLRSHVLKNTLELVKEINLLSVKEQVFLFSMPDKYLNNNYHDINLEVKAAKKALYEFLIKPSKEVQDAYQNNV